MTESDYIELRAHSAYSLLRGTTAPEALLAEAARLGMRGLALTDHNNVYGAISFQKTAQALGIQPILGAELTIESHSAEDQGFHGVYHRMSEKHLHRYIAEFAGRHNVRPLDTSDQMASVVRGADGKRLKYADLIAD